MPCVVRAHLQLGRYSSICRCARDSLGGVLDSVCSDILRLDQGKSLGPYTVSASSIDFYLP